jgi:hypothetical protein
MVFQLLFLLVLVYVVYRSAMEMYGVERARKQCIRTMPLMVLVYSGVVLGQLYWRSLDRFLLVITAILLVVSILVSRYQRKTLGGLLLKFELPNESIQIAKIYLEILRFILASYLVLGLLIGIFLLASIYLHGFSFGDSIALLPPLGSIALEAILLAFIVAISYEFNKNTKSMRSGIEVEFREKGIICTSGRPIRWEHIRSYQWEPTKPNLLTIHNKPSLFDMGYWSIAIPERYRNDAIDILARYLPG